MSKRICNTCGKLKPFSKFYKNKNTKDGRRHDCKDCERHRFKNSRLKWRFCIDLKEYSRMLLEQNSLCAICKRPERRIEKSGTSADLCVDHDHRTGRVRGLLCRTCNSMLGLANDDIDILLSGAVYLEKHKS